MKKSILIPLACLFVVLLGSGMARAQPINMGSNPVNFGNGCTYSFIRNTSYNTQKLAFGYQWSCTNPTGAFETIWFNTAYGRIGMGVSNPSYQVHLSQNSAAKPGSSYWTVVSDRRFKKDVHSFKDGLNVIRKMNPVTFRYKENVGIDTKEEFVGVIAQELQEVAPYMVKQMEGEDGTTDYLAVDLHALDFALVNAMQELDGEVAALKETNAALLARLEALEQALGSESLGEGGASMDPNGKMSDEGVSMDPNGKMGIDGLAPNPGAMETELRFHLPAGSGNGRVEVTDMNGRVCARKTVSAQEMRTSIDLHELSPGQYIVRLTAANGQSVTQKLVVAR